LVRRILFDGITIMLGPGLWQCDRNAILDAAERLALRGLGLEEKGDT
jgi:hypothetical protein